MAHYAILDEQNIVINVIVGTDESSSGIDWEKYYGNLYNSTVKRTSYNTFENTHVNGGTPFRGNFASVGYTYDESLDAFIPPKPFDSWTLNTDRFDWDPPVPRPVDHNIWVWDEDNQQWNQDTFV